MHFYINETAPWEELGDGIRRKIVGHTPHLMSGLVQFDKGAVALEDKSTLLDQFSPRRDDYLAI